MSTLPTIPSKEQLETMQVLQRIGLIRNMFWVVSIGFFMVLIALIVSMFLPSVSTSVKVSFGCIDSLLGWSFRAIVANLYPNPIPRRPKK